MKNKITYLLILILALIAVFCFLFFIGNENENSLKEINLKFESRIETLKKFKFEDYFTVGWIQVQGTHIDLPVMTPVFEANEFEKNVDVDFSFGWRSINYNNGENRLAINGHNVLNVSSKPLRNVDFLSNFEELLGFVYADFAKENLYIMYTDEKGNENKYAIYAIGFEYVETEDGNSIPYDEKDKIIEYINYARNNSIYDYEIDVNGNDDLISLITCTRMFSTSGKTQFRIDARKIRENEKIYRYKVSINDNYDLISEKIYEENV